MESIPPWAVGLGVSLISVPLVQPFATIFTSVRANYNVKGIEKPREGVFSMTGRIIRLEGYSGLWKGLFPSFLALATSPLLGFASALAPPLSLFVAPLISVIPMTVMNRAITSPNSAIAPRGLLDLLAAPGLYPAQFLLSFAGTMSAFAAARTVGYAIEDVNNGADPSILAGAVSAALLFRLLTTLVTSPLEVLVTRLSVLSGDEALATPNSDKIPIVAGEDATVNLRPTAYLGFFDAISSIINEEGWTALYVTWGWSAVSTLVAGWMEYNRWLSA